VTPGPAGGPGPGATPLERAVTAIEAENAEDPRRVSLGGEDLPLALAQGRRAAHWVGYLAPGGLAPSDSLVLAAHAHHLRRFDLPRSSFPEGRSGYLRWRREQHRRHAATVAGLLEEAGFGDDVVERVAQLVGKAAPAGDPEAQALEDAACLVCLETDWADLAGRLDADKLAEVQRKTLAKMSPAARALLPLPPTP
jgi:hypothetical protein